MAFWELMAAALSSAGLFASILGAFLTYAARKNGEVTRNLIGSTGEATRDLIGSTGEATRDLIGSTGEATRDLIRSMEERMSKHFAEFFERMDQRADQRHREVIEAISALKAT